MAIISPGDAAAILVFSVLALTLISLIHSMRQLSITQETLSATMPQLMLKENEYLSTEEQTSEYLGELLHFENKAILCSY